MLLLPWFSSVIFWEVPTLFLQEVEQIEIIVFRMWSAEPSGDPPKLWTVLHSFATVP